MGQMSQTSLLDLQLIADEFSQKSAQLDPSVPFTQLRKWHLGSPMNGGIPPLSFVSQVLSLFVDKGILDDRNVEYLMRYYDKDVIERANKFRKEVLFPGNYTHPCGMFGVRKDVSDWIHERDGYPCDPDSIYMTNGASEAMPTALSGILKSSNDVLLLPKPGFFLWQEHVQSMGGKARFYHLSEDKEWSIEIAELQAAYQDALDLGLNVKAICVINPGNPVPSVLSYQDIKSIIQFCEARNLVVIADEVYQQTVYERKFISFRKVWKDMESRTVLASFHSGSKGIYGEGGYRAGYVQFEGADSEFMKGVGRFRNLFINANIIGQLVMAMLAKPPKLGDASFPLFEKERNDRLRTYTDNAKIATEFFNSLPCMECQPVKGSFYAFPRLMLPDSFDQLAVKKGCAPDHLYCQLLLRRAGIMVMHGSLMGQRPNTSHLRLAIAVDTEDPTKRV